MNDRHAARDWLLWTGLALVLSTPGIVHLLLFYSVMTFTGLGTSPARSGDLMGLSYVAAAASSVGTPLAGVLGVIALLRAPRWSIRALVLLFIAVSVAGAFNAHYHYGFSPAALLGPR
jgi:hypothetical protein